MIFYWFPSLSYAKNYKKELVIHHDNVAYILITGLD